MDLAQTYDFLCSCEPSVKHPRLLRCQGKISGDTFFVLFPLSCGEVMMGRVREVVGDVVRFSWLVPSTRNKEEIKDFRRSMCSGNCIVLHYI